MEKLARRRKVQKMKERAKKLALKAKLEKIKKQVESKFKFYRKLFNEKIRSSIDIL